MAVAALNGPFDPAMLPRVTPRQPRRSYGLYGDNGSQRNALPRDEWCRQALDSRHYAPITPRGRSGALSSTTTVWSVPPASFTTKVVVPVVSASSAAGV